MLPIHFAPLQGYTDNAYRNVHDVIFGGVEAYYTPFIRIERGELRKKDIREALPENDETGKLVPQIIVRDAEEFHFLVEKVKEMGHKRIDVNMGCPFPLQARKGRGAGILSNPDKAREVFEAINAVEDVEFSIKMRLGNESADDCFALLPLINATSLTHVTLHPRIATQQYKGEVDMERFKAFLEVCNHDVIYNGDITSIEDIERIERDYPQVKGVMIGRGLLMRPSLAKEYAKGEKISDEKLLKMVMRMHDELINEYSQTLQGDGHLLMKMKTYWEHLEDVIGRKQYKLIKKAINMAKYNAAVAVI
jgi:tRNA-dihydrouridine synthase